MLHPTMLDDVGPTMLASFEQAFKKLINNELVIMVHSLIF